MTRTLTLSASLIVAAVIAIHGQGGRITVFEGARLLIGDGGAPIAGGAFLVFQDGQIRAVGARAP